MTCQTLFRIIEVRKLTFTVKKEAFDTTQGVKLFRVLSDETTLRVFLCLLPARPSNVRDLCGQTRLAEKVVKEHVHSLVCADALTELPGSFPTHYILSPTAIKWLRRLGCYTPKSTTEMASPTYS